MESRERVKAHLSDPDIESKAQAALAETVTLITHNGKQAPADTSRQAGVLTNFWGTPLFRCVTLTSSPKQLL